ncbi:MAG: ABC transporter permease subunit [Firmicutes bacterium]|nr:ABC transporter permease subunit [Bacillota bacterium]
MKVLVSKPKVIAIKNPPSLLKDFKLNYELYILSIPVVIYYLIFHYFPMYGLQIAFKDFKANLGIWGSPWIGFEHFIRFFKSYNFWALIQNTLGISLYQLLLGFPMPIIFAVMVNEFRYKSLKKGVQMLSYAPHFISTVVMTGIIIAFLAPRTGVINQLRGVLGHGSIDFLSRPDLFKSIFVTTNIWQNMGWDSIIYFAALSSIDMEMCEAASIDGASKFQRVWYINIPSIMRVAVILLIMNCGRLMDIGFEKIFLLQNPLNMQSSDVISTYVYRAGILGAQYSFSAAVGLFNTIVNVILLLTVDKISRSVSEYGLF